MLNLTSIKTAFAVVVLGLSGGSAAAATQWYVNTGGFSHHFEPTQAANRQWNETHPGLGLERRDIDPDSNWHTSWSAGLMRDSRSFWGGYAGAAYSRHWHWNRSIQTSLGIGAFAFYRSVSWSGERALTPALLPMASIGSVDGRLGFNVVYVPKLAAGSAKSSVPVVMGQFVFRFR